MRLVVTFDGGGFHGAAAATCLATVEKELGIRIADEASLVAGTSTGALIASSLSIKGSSGEYIANQYNLDLGNTIFPREFMDKVLDLKQLNPKYDGKGKTLVLQKIFESSKLKDARTPLLVTSYNLNTRRPAIFFSEKPSTKELEISNICDASSAAPIYFPCVQMNDGHWYVDGGVLMNNPADLAYAYAQRKWPGEDIRVLSFGTGNSTVAIDGSNAKNWGIQWIVNDLVGIIREQYHAVNFRMETLLGPRYVRLSGPLTGVGHDLDLVNQRQLKGLQDLGRIWALESLHKLDKIFNSDLPCSPNPWNEIEESCSLIS